MYIYGYPLENKDDLCRCRCYCVQCTLCTCVSVKSWRPTCYSIVQCTPTAIPKRAKMSCVDARAIVYTVHCTVCTVHIYCYPLESKDNLRSCMRYTGSEHCTVCCVYSTHLPLSLREQRRPVKSWRCTCYCTMYTYRYSGDGCHVCLANVLYLLLLAISLCHTQTDTPSLQTKAPPPFFSL